MDPPVFQLLQNTWEVWQFTNFVNTCDQRTFSGSMLAHSVLRVKEDRSLDIDTFLAHFNGARGTLVDGDGNTAVVQQIGRFEQVSDNGTGTYVVTSTDAGRVITTGPLFDVHFDVTIVLYWDGAAIQVLSFIATVRCTGQES